MVITVWRKRIARLWSTWPRRLALVGFAFVIVAWLAIEPLTRPLPVTNSTQVAGISLKAEKKVYTLGQTPELLLHFQHVNRQAGFFKQLLAAPQVYAATSPEVKVMYGGREATDVTASVAPSGDDYVITLQSQNQLKPGTYDVTVTGDTTDGQPFSESTDFAWGVLAVNTDKSIYLPNETARLQMGVLDSEGHTVCTAPLQLTITDPEGNQQQVPYQNSDSCKGDGFTNVPDYTASYKTGGVGQYQISLGIQNTAYVVTDSFEVRASVPFDITRNAVTRIYPIHPYGVGMHIVANQDFSGTATETISDPRFKILQTSPDADVQTLGDKVVIAWKVDWQAGKHYDLSYQYFAPPVSPAFYTLGPLKLTDSSGQLVFQEARTWQLAGDAAITLVKQTEVNVTTANTTNTTSVTSTAGNTLVLLYAGGATGLNGALSSISDSASNTWVYSNAPPNQNPPANFITGVSSNVAIGYVTNASAITNITVNIQTSRVFAFDLLEFSNVDKTNPVDQSASNANASSSTSHTTSTLTATTCDKPTTSQLLRGGEYFCQSVNELVIGLVNAGHQALGYTLNTSGFTATTALTPLTTSDEAAAAYQITPTSASYSINWTSNSAANTDATCIMVFRQNGNTSGGDDQSFFWAK